MSWTTNHLRSSGPARAEVIVPRPELARSPEPSLRYLELQMTTRCNLRCRHCYIGDGRPANLSLEDLRTVLREFEALQGLRVLITGGEPILHPDFEAFNEMLPDHFLRKVLFTNGVLLRQDLLKRLKVNEIQVSIDGMQRAHDALRGQGTFDATIDALRRSIDAGFDASVSTMVTTGNLDDFDDMEKLFRSMEVREWSVDVPCISGRLADNGEFAVSPEIGGKYLAYGYGGGMHASGQGFACGLHLMSILPDGRAAKCTFYGDRAVGTVGEGLRTCWARMHPIKLSDLNCSCEFREVCRGGCRYRAEIAGDPLGKDPYRCSLYGIIDEPE